MSGLAERLAALSGRERLLLAAMLLIALPLALVFLVAEPLLDRRDAARDARIEALALRDWVTVRDREWRATSEAARTGPGVSSDPVGLAGVEAALRDAGLRDAIEVLEDTGGGRIALRLENVTFVALGRFLSDAETALGYDIGRARITRAETPGDVLADLELRPKGD